MFANSYHRYSPLLIKPLSYCRLFIFYSQVEIRFFIPGEKWVLQHFLFCPDAGWNIHLSTHKNLTKLFKKPHLIWKHLDIFASSRELAHAYPWSSSSWGYEFMSSLLPFSPVTLVFRLCYLIAKNPGEGMPIRQQPTCFLSCTFVGPCQPPENIWMAGRLRSLSLVEICLPSFTHSHAKSKNPFERKLLISFINLFGNATKFPTWKRRLGQATTFLCDEFTCATLPSGAVLTPRLLLR